jgi:hypothetical protein
MPVGMYGDDRKMLREKDKGSSTGSDAEYSI